MLNRIGRTRKLGFDPNRLFGKARSPRALGRPRISRPEKLLPSLLVTPCRPLPADVFVSSPPHVSHEATDVIPCRTLLWRGVHETAVLPTLAPGPPMVDPSRQRFLSFQGLDPPTAGPKPSNPTSCRVWPIHKLRIWNFSALTQSDLSF